MYFAINRFKTLKTLQKYFKSKFGVKCYYFNQYKICHHLLSSRAANYFWTKS